MHVPLGSIARALGRDDAHDVHCMATAGTGQAAGAAAIPALPTACEAVELSGGPRAAQKATKKGTAAVEQET